MLSDSVRLSKKTPYGLVRVSGAIMISYLDFKGSANETMVVSRGRGTAHVSALESCASVISFLYISESLISGTSYLDLFSLCLT